MTQTTQPDSEPGIDLTKAGWSFAVMTDPEFARDPRPVYERLRQGCPVRDELSGTGRAATVVMSRFEDVERVFRDPKLFSSRFGEGVGGLGNDRPLIPLQIDPPEHKKYRVLLDPYFAPRSMALLENDIALLANQLIDGFIERRSCDFTTEFAVPFPCRSFLRLLGLPIEDLEFFLRVKDGITRGNGELDMEKQAAARAAAGRECYAYLQKELDELEQRPRDGLLSKLLHAEVE